MAENSAESARNQVKDPVCGMMIDAHTNLYKARHKGKEYAFCSDICRDSFMLNPSRFLERKTA